MNNDQHPRRIRRRIWLGYHPTYERPADLRLMTCDLSDVGFVMYGPYEIVVEVPAVLAPATAENEPDAATRAVLAAHLDTIRALAGRPAPEARP